LIEVSGAVSLPNYPPVFTVKSDDVPGWRNKEWLSSFDSHSRWNGEMLERKTDERHVSRGGGGHYTGLLNDNRLHRFLGAASRVSTVRQYCNDCEDS
jgi:hypothetical protein